MAEFDMDVDTLHYRNLQHVPPTLRPRVCMCQDPGPPMFDPRKRPAAVVCCSACQKPYRWNIRHCTTDSCRKWFIKDFRRKAIDCVRHTKCFQCSFDEPMCDCSKETSTRPDFGPLSFNPREVSQEEMDAAFKPSPFD